MVYGGSKSSDQDIFPLLHNHCFTHCLTERSATRKSDVELKATLRLEKGKVTRQLVGKKAGI